jgi:integrase
MLGVLYTFFTGVVVGELATLKTSDYDASNSMLMIERTKRGE